MKRRDTFGDDFFNELATLLFKHKVWRFEGKIGVRDLQGVAYDVELYSFDDGDFMRLDVTQEHPAVVSFYREEKPFNG